VRGVLFHFKGNVDNGSAGVDAEFAELGERFDMAGRIIRLKEGDVGIRFRRDSRRDVKLFERFIGLCVKTLLDIEHDRDHTLLSRLERARAGDKLD
jgi:hypothetical protein